MVIKIEKELDEMEAVLIKMGRKTAQMHQHLYAILKEFDRDAALDIIQSDERINLLEEEVNDLAVSALALLSPVASDLRRVVTGIKIASELERIADYAKNTAVYLIRHDTLDETILEYAQMMEQTFLSMLGEAMIAYEERDVEAAFEIPAQDEVIDQMICELYHKLNDCEDLNQLKQVLRAGELLRNMERSGDHTKNICEHIIYLIKGQHYDFG